MKKIKDMLDTPKNVILLVVCIVAVLSVIGGGIGLALKYFASPQITVEKATEIALLDANVLEEDANYIKTKQDSEDGVGLYDIEIRTETMKYEYEINRRTGNIYSKSKEPIVSQETTQSGSLQASGTSDASQQPLEQPVIDQQETGAAEKTPQTADTLQGTAGDDAAQAKTETPQGTEGNDTAQPKTQTPQGTAGGAAAQAKTETSKGAAGNNTAQQSTAPQGAQNNSGQISLEEAKSAALADAGLAASEVVFTKEKSDYEDGIAVYDIEFYDAVYEYEYEINAATGAVYSKDVEAHHRSGTGHSGNHTNTGASIGEEEAKSIALGHAGFALADVSLLKVKLDMDDGRTVYEVEFYKDNREYDYTIDASTGTILEYDVD